MTTLILAILTVESSYLDNLERPAGAVPDTVQFWFTPETQWRIKTYAIDHDIHVHPVATVEGEEPLDTGVACESIGDAYDDVLSELLMLEFPDPADEASVREILDESQLTGTLVAARDGCYFYNPDGGAYRIQSDSEG